MFSSKKEEPSEAHRSRFTLGWNAILLASLVVTVASFLVHEIYSLDFWWHLAIGRDIVETLSIPVVDRYSVLGFGRPYHDSHWLFQVAIALGYRFLGFLGPQLLLISCGALTFATVYRSTRESVEIAPAVLLVFLAAMASVERLLVRPEIITYACLAGSYALFQQRRYRSWSGLALLVIIQVIWANSHGLFVLGPFIAGCYLMASWLDPAAVGSGDRKWLAGMLVATTFATFLTPFGVKGWSYAWLLATEATATTQSVFENLGELSPTFGEAARSAPSFWFYAVLLVLAIASSIMELHQKRVSARLLIVLALAAASLTGRRNVVLFALVAAPFIAESMRSVSALDWLSRGRVKLVIAALVAGYASYPLSGSYYRHVEIPARFGFGVTPSFFPHELPAFLDQIGFRGNVLNSNTLGGFYLFHGYPERLPLTDGRWEVYDPKMLAATLSIARDPSRYPAFLERPDIQGILLAHTSPEARAMLPSLPSLGSWRLVYCDRAASFWVRSAGYPGTPTISPDDEGSLPAILRVDDGIILDSFLSKVGARDAVLRNLERTIPLEPRNVTLLTKLATAQMEHDRFDEAAITLSRIVELEPRNAAALNELAFLAFREGDLDRAISLMEQVIEIVPDEPLYRENLERLRSAARSQQRDAK